MAKRKKQAAKVFSPSFRVSRKMMAASFIVVFAVAGTIFLTASFANSGPCTQQVFRQGSRGQCVKYMQTMLNWAYIYTNRAPRGTALLNVDGSFGPKTASAVRGWQSLNGLQVDAVVGNHTWTALCYAPFLPWTHQFTPQGFVNAARYAGCINY